MPAQMGFGVDNFESVKEAPLPTVSPFRRFICETDWTAVGNQNRHIFARQFLSDCDDFFVGDVVGLFVAFRPYAAYAGNTNASNFYKLAVR